MCTYLCHVPFALVGHGLCGTIVEKGFQILDCIIIVLLSGTAKRSTTRLLGSLLWSPVFCVAWTVSLIFYWYFLYFWLAQFLQTRFGRNKLVQRWVFYCIVYINVECVCNLVYFDQNDWHGWHLVRLCYNMLFSQEAYNSQLLVIQC
jgi:hypothetical protein